MLFKIGKFSCIYTLVDVCGNDVYSQLYIEMCVVKMYVNSSMSVVKKYRNVCSNESYQKLVVRGKDRYRCML